MKKYSFTDVNRGAGDILDEAMSKPVALTKRGREKIIMLPVDLYHELIKARSHAQSFSYADAPQNILDDLDRGLDDILNSDEHV
ncbi:type II toxin-antitoxin system Phd/YefM family antitoxin [Bartonella krasnovii]|uniref:type II toxin-antitoxin system Phd/YefM family antitoxin n=1 Tax=Bartonella TaxID=773 RepID=UPI001115B565|nr:MULTISPECIES: type II toxin-antitoxin system Phd/YefM family antitoxin [Bartonella]UNF44102.1 type II toxin-antitoxin system Phd/YefM family antitoxin [Bartonella krasnovii]UNF47288.1 type II toxin-antitoxin system Phd/YefM family antitoxin [Bartonella krasnovii]